MSDSTPEKKSSSEHDSPTIFERDDVRAQPDKDTPDSSATEPAPKKSNETDIHVPGEAQAMPKAATKKSKMPKRIGDYELLSEIGRGGMGVVLKARDVRLGRIVALKMLSGGVLAKPEDVHRFETEAAAVAQLQHSHIVGLFDVGNFDGQPYFSMEYVSGSSLLHRVDSGVVPSRLAARYIEKTARAVHFAHSKGIIHRDLKPANILLDDEDNPKIADFGLAKLMRSDSGQTRTGAIIGTPSYMAPEQASARKDVGPACDIYSLGAILYELVTGNPPFLGETALETLQMVAYKEPVAPHLVNPKVDRDLETICLKSLEKDPARRYPSAQALADDLSRYLKGEPIAARRLGPTGRLLKWVRRKPGIAAALFATLMALIGFSFYQWQVAVNERALREDAEESRRQAIANEELLLHLYYVGQMQQAQFAWRDANLDRARKLIASWNDGAAKKKLRGWEWHYLQRLCGGRSTLTGQTSRVRSVAYNKDGTLLAVAGGEATLSGKVEIWQTASGKLLATLPNPHSDTVRKVVFRPDGKELATASVDGTIRLWKTAPWTESAVLNGHWTIVRGKGKRPARVNCVAYAPDGKKLVSVGSDGLIILWDLARPLAPKRLRQDGPEITCVAFSPNGDVFATAGRDEIVRLWSAQTGEELHTLRGHQGEVMSVAFSPSGNVLVSGGGPGMRMGQVRLWNVADGTLLRLYKGLSDRILSVAVSNKVSVTPGVETVLIAAGDTDGVVHVWDERRSSEARRFRADTQPVYSLAFSPNGESLATGAGNGVTRIWNSAGGQQEFWLEGHSWTEAAAYSPDGRFLATAGWSRKNGNSVLLWDAKSGRQRQVFTGPTRTIRVIAFAASGKYLAVAGDEGLIRLYDLERLQPAQVIKVREGRITSMAIHPSRKQIAIGGDDDGIHVWDLSAAKEVKLFQGGNGAVSLAYSADGRFLASGDTVGVVRVWDLPANRLLQAKKHKGWVNAVAFTSDSTRLATAGNDQTIRLWDLSTGDDLLLEGATRAVTALAFHPQGKRLASVGNDRLVRIWDLTTLQEILQLDGPQGILRSVAFSPNGQRLAAAGRYTGVFIWNAAEPRRR